MSAADVAPWMIQALVASGLLIALVLLVRGPVRRVFGPSVAYALWALPLLRLVLPPMPAWLGSAVTPIDRAGDTLTVMVFDGTAPAVPAVAAASPVPWGTLLAAVWAIGAAGFLLFHIVRYTRFCASVLRRATMQSKVRGITMVVSDAAPGPLAFGIFRRIVAFPIDFADRYDSDERELALAHEVGHHLRGDLIANWLALAVLAAHWFNPLAWIAFRAFRNDQELANDAGILATRSSSQRHAYGRAIVKAAHGGAVSAACHLHTINDLKGRLKMLARSPASRRRLFSGATFVGVLVLGGLGLTASGSGAAAIAETVSAQVTSPTPPAPPAPPAPQADAPVAPVPPAPPAHPAKGKKRVVIVHNGKSTSYEGDAADAFLAANPEMMPPPPPAAPQPPVRVRVMHLNEAKGGKVIRFRDPDGKEQTITVPPVPQVSERNCAGSGPAVDDRSEGGRRRITICTNRVERMTQEAERTAANAAITEQQARRSARNGLATARAAIERDRNLTTQQRDEALQGLAQAEAELASND